MAGMAEEVIPGVPRSVEPLTRRLRSVHARLDLCVHRLISSELVAVRFVHELQRLITTTGIRSRLFVLYASYAVPGIRSSPPSPWAGR
jgi:hypothetical protein